MDAGPDGHGSATGAYEVAGMTKLLAAREATPATWPTKPTGLSPAADALPESVVWQRIEGYTSTRFSERQCVWVVEGTGEFDAPLEPATITMAERFEHGAYTEVTTLLDGPLGGPVLTSEGPWRIAATVGSTTTPEDVQEAYRRLAEYMAESGPGGGVSSHSEDVGPVTISETRDPKWLAKALQLSGAADLLRPYRRARHV